MQTPTKPSKPKSAGDKMTTLRWTVWRVLSNKYSRISTVEDSGQWDSLVQGELIQWVHLEQVNPIALHTIRILIPAYIKCKLEYLIYNLWLFLIYDRSIVVLLYCCIVVLLYCCLVLLLSCCIIVYTTWNLQDER
jgi:hypothetical protein